MTTDEVKWLVYKRLRLKMAGWLLFSYMLTSWNWVIIIIWIFVCFKFVSRANLSRVRGYSFHIHCLIVSFILGCMCFLAWFIQFCSSFPGPPKYLHTGRKGDQGQVQTPSLSHMDLVGINELTYSKVILKGEVLYKCQAWLTSSQVIRHLNIMHLFWILGKWMCIFIFKSTII